MKRCYKCEIVKPIDDFNKNKTKLDGYQNICRVCSNARSRQYYAENTEQHKKDVSKINRARKQDLRAWFNEIKSKLCCEVCGEDHFATLDFHHEDPNEKDFALSKMITGGYSKERVQKEIDKCKVLCANCHRKFHYEMDRLP